MPAQPTSRADSPARWGRTADRGERPDRVVVTGSTSLGLAIARACPRTNVEVFEGTWSEVDRARQRIDAAGLGRRVRVRPRCAGAFRGIPAEGCCGHGWAGGKPPR